MGTLADCVLADAFLIHPLPLVSPTTIRKVRGLRKKYRQLVTEKLFTSK